MPNTRRTRLTNETLTSTAKTAETTMITSSPSKLISTIPPHIQAELDELRRRVASQQ